MFNSIDELRIPSLLHISEKSGTAFQIISVFWQLPPHWLKVNTDGSSLGSLGAAGAGGIFRTASGLPRGTFSFGIQSGYAFMAELSVAIYAIEVA